MRDLRGQPLLFAPAPAHNGTASSRAAAEMAKPLASKTRTEILVLLAGHPDGLTEEQIARTLGRRLAGVCGRVNELGNLGSVVALAAMGKTSSGRPAMRFVRADDAGTRPLAPWPRSRVDWKSRHDVMERRAIDAERRVAHLEELLLRSQNLNPPADCLPVSAGGGADPAAPGFLSLPQPHHHS